jgi:hypothetical protein
MNAKPGGDLDMWLAEAAATQGRFSDFEARYFLEVWNERGRGVALNATGLPAASSQGEALYLAGELADLWVGPTDLDRRSACHRAFGALREGVRVGLYSRLVPR